MKILVAGYGNPFREDDSVGHVLAPRISEYLESMDNEVELWIDQQLLPEIVEDMRDKDMAFFVDSLADSSKGDHIFEEMEPDPDIEGLNIHSMGPGWILHLMRELHMQAPRTFLISVAGESFNFSENMTRECKQRTDKCFEDFKRWWENRE
jgi:hydrogenase maturation protease